MNWKTTEECKLGDASSKIQARLSDFFSKMNEIATSNNIEQNKVKNVTDKNRPWDDFEDFDEAFSVVTQEVDERNCNQNIVAKEKTKETAVKCKSSLEGSKNRNTSPATFEEKKETCKLTDVIQNEKKEELKSHVAVGKEGVNKQCSRQKRDVLFNDIQINTQKSLGLDHTMDDLLGKCQSLLARNVHTFSLEEKINANMDIKKLNVSILEKVFVAFCALPESLLEKLPGFDASVFNKVKRVHRNMNERLTLLEKMSCADKKSECKNFSKDADKLNSLKSVNELEISTPKYENYLDTCTSKDREKKLTSKKSFMPRASISNHLKSWTDQGHSAFSSSSNSSSKPHSVSSKAVKQISPPKPTFHDNSSKRAHNFNETSPEELNSYPISPQSTDEFSFGNSNESYILEINSRSCAKSVPNPKVSPPKHKNLSPSVTFNPLQKIKHSKASDFIAKARQLNSTLSSSPIGNDVSLNSSLAMKINNKIPQNKNPEKQVTSPNIHQPAIQSSSADITPRKGNGAFVFKRPFSMHQPPSSVSTVTSPAEAKTVFGTSSHSAFTRHPSVLVAEAGTAPKIDMHEPLLCASHVVPVDAKIGFNASVRQTLTKAPMSSNTSPPFSAISNNKLAIPLFKKSFFSAAENSTTTSSHFAAKSDENNSVVNKNETLIEDDFPEDSVLENDFPEDRVPEEDFNFDIEPASQDGILNKSIQCNEDQSSLNTSVFDDSDVTVSTIGKFLSKHRNDGISGEFDGYNFTHSEEMMKVFRSTFGLHSFRPCQLQAVNAILLGNDSFILMPTGGGKSLCYQLPAVLKPGVTIVVSPLKSLILDQVQKLNALDIPSAHLSGEISARDEHAIYLELSKREPRLKLLYVTPEKLSASSKLQDTLKTLHALDKLAHFVVDEAHCVSQWGHDFRPDYKKLNVLRKKYPNVPMLALTATATERVRYDILHQLSMKNPKWFICSFNRPNLQYQVLEKAPKSVLDDIVNLIKKDFHNACGIVYCLSRKDCENATAYLKENRIAAGTYHAGLSDNERAKIQNTWLSNRIKVVCATIAFGMGIDKPDVRFVIHQTLPKSIEGLYQEAGRAGRDGQPARCIVYYCYKDVYRHRRLIESDSDNADVKNTHLTNLNSITAYCENHTECRRVQQLSYFGEIFGKSECVKRRNTACDNCLCSDDFYELDFTKEAQEIVRCVGTLTLRSRGRRGCITILQLVDIIKGSQASKIKELGYDKLPLHGIGKSWQRSDATHFIRHLVLKGFLCEQLITTKDDMVAAYLYLGPKANVLLKQNMEVKLLLRNKITTSAEPSTKTSTANNPFAEKLESIQEKCYADLMDVCQGIAASLSINTSAVMNVQAIKAMSESLPETPEEMLNIPHVTRANFEKFGQPLLDVTIQYAMQKLVVLSEQEIFENENKTDINVNNGNDDFNDVDIQSTTSDSPYFNGNRNKRKYGSQKGSSKKRFKGGKFKRGGKGGQSRWNQASGSRLSSAKGIGSVKAGQNNSRGRGIATPSLGLMSLPQPSGLPSKRPGFLPQPKVFSL